MKIRWKPTVIGGQVGKDDFCAYLLGVSVGRIHTELQGGANAVWSWTFKCGSGDFLKSNSGVEKTGEAASEKLRERIKLYLATPVEAGGGKGLEPEEMPLDASSDNLQYLKAHNPEAFWKRIDDIRAGRVDRNYYRWIDSKRPLEALTEEDYV